MRFLTNQSEREEAARTLRKLLDARAEWFCTVAHERGGAGDARAVLRGEGRARQPGAGEPSALRRDAAKALRRGERAMRRDERAMRRGERALLRSGEWEVRAAGGALLFECATEAGWRAWRVKAWESDGARLLLEVARRAGAERARLELVPRASALEGAREVIAARRAACEMLAETACARLPGARVESARLSAGARRSEPGRYARVLLRRGRVELFAVTGAVARVRAHEADAMLASALLWWSRVLDSPGAKNKSNKSNAAPRGFARAPQLWLVADAELAKPLSERLALLREDVRRSISLFEIDNTPSEDEDAQFGDDGAHLEDDGARIEDDHARSEGDGILADDVSASFDVSVSFDHNGASSESEGKLFGESDDGQQGIGGATGRATTGGRARAGDGATARLVRVELPALGALVEAAPSRKFRVGGGLSETAARIVTLAPGEIDVLRAGHGETLRFCGLPFARVRRLLGEERVWFGVPGAGPKLLLGRDNWPRLAKLLEELAAHRRADAADKCHLLYRAAPEGWLESVLRRDITRLDPGLVVSPLHVQFRTSRGERGARPVDLLALRRDGRLVVVELKVSEDAALPLQGADYWRRVEAHRRNGDLARARLFGPLEIADAPALVYLVAPLFSFRRDFAALARMISPDIEIYRFDLNEDWRAGVRVARRCALA